MSECHLYVIIHNFADIAHHILQPLEKMRRENDLVKIFPQYLTGEDLFGLSDPTVLKIIESVSESGSRLVSVPHWWHVVTNLYLCCGLCGDC